MIKRIKENKGITLIALVVTIIVLIILSVISITAVFGDNGILSQSSSTKKYASNSIQTSEKELTGLLKDYSNMMQEEPLPEVVDEDAPVISSFSVTEKTESAITVSVSASDSTTEIAKYEYQKGTDAFVTGNSTYTFTGLSAGTEYTLTVRVTDSAGNTTTKTITVTTTIPSAGTVVSKPGTWTSDKVTPIADGNGGTIPLPDGFYYLGGNRSSGLVISDKNGDSMTASGTSSGNQFVWIPVDSADDFTRTSFDTSTGEPTTGLSSGYEEPNSSGYSTETSDYNTMKTQVLLYGGFYVGRYEAGINSTSLRSGTTSANTVVTKKGVAPYNYVQWGTSTTSLGTSGAAYLGKRMYSSSSSVTSTLMYSSQWDAMCRYIGDSQRTLASTTSSPSLTGSLSTDVSKNIYDLAGNCYEWTMEAANFYTGTSDDYRTIRGGAYSYADPISARDKVPVNVTKNLVMLGFRCAFYIK